ncbi:Uncharacterized protein TCM_027900 [Theobroma cacao]|uniref:Uncharacterized protein n=1 Tax=Theobroma cacao TaxID=3641 RepID=A0A061GAE0_THECC|nr:Uncharacterized protein TCM_027900 [Theobroma cacao]
MAFHLNGRPPLTFTHDLKIIILIALTLSFVSMIDCIAATRMPFRYNKIRSAMLALLELPKSRIIIHRSSAHAHSHTTYN